MVNKTKSCGMEKLWYRTYNDLYSNGPLCLASWANNCINSRGARLLLVGQDSFIATMPCTLT